MTTLQLATNQESFDEWKDQDILIDVPREVYHQGDTFEIPIRLEGNSDLQTFVMRARVRQGLHITGARLTDSSNQWNIHVDIKEHQKTGTVTVYVRDSKLYKKLKDVQEVFRWQMEVAEDTYDSKDLGRVIWSIEYQQDRAAHEHFPLTTGDSKVVSQINIRSKDQQRLVPVLKVWEILNVAVLTGTSQQYPLKIYAVNSLDRLQDVTAQTKCHSVEVDVLKVSMDCSSVYVDGAENRGSHNVTIIAKYGQTTAFFDVTVWVPEERLDIQLSDRKLSRVKNWKSADSSPRKSKSSEASLKPYESNGQAGVRCELVHQQALVQVYTRFYIQTPKQTEYFMGSGAYFQVTNLVKGLLRMSDPGVAVLTADNIIRGREEGRTEIQLQSAKNGHLLAATEVIVSHDKVSVVQLGVRLVTGMTMFVEPSSLLPGALTATAHIDSQLLSEHHLGMLAVEVVYSDLTSMPVELLPTDLFHLEVHTENSSIVDIALNDGPANLPQVVARGEGRGELLKVSLHGSEECARRESRPLITSPMFIDLDFSREARTYSQHHPYQMDAHYDTNRASDRWEDAAKQQPVFSIKPQSQAKNAVLKGKFEDVSKDKDSDDIQMVKNALGELVDEHPEAQQEPLRTKTVREGLTPLEIGMYVLLAVFCVAITVFMINCVVFFVRYKHKQKPRKTGSTDAIKDANDWVWIGRATLERNSVYTDSSRALMPEEDFNGNLSERSERPLSVGSNSSTSSRSNSSNRNSVVSTYRGSECSIRITANPLTEEGAMSRLPEETQSQMGIPQWDYEEMGMNYDELLKYFDNLKESNA
ncbi:hypothetical protein DPMN_011109 [Dreissena polymorpha]|uniref:Transmembrane protein 132E n=2 Tax=Dreissena polymorpha TaxID=45954 RepID=A0A9D4N4E5_DREPO|nr:hypothetical protein DPMN_011109 [Dreissena polymorpha]